MRSAYKKKLFSTISIASLALVSVTFGIAFGFTATAQTEQTDPSSPQEEYNALNQQIEEKKLKLQEIDQRIKNYEESLKVKQQEALSIQGQISLLEGQITQTNADIERIKLEVERTGLEIQQAVLESANKQEQLEVLQAQLADYIRLMHEYDQQTAIYVLLNEGSFSDFFSRIQYTESISSKIKENVLTVLKAKEDLEQFQEIQKDKQDELSSLQERLTASAADLQNQQSFKTDLLAQTKESQELYEDLLVKSQRDQKQVDAEIFSIERQAREKLADEGSSLLDSVATLSWPVASHNGISAYFHDPTYIFRKYFEHPAIDIRVRQGTPLYAPADGYVSRAKNAGMGYSFIMLVHNTELSTVYGHVSRIDVTEEQFVRRGQQIGLSGGMPGTPGAGNLTTGPHLHLEVRLKGIPVNPLDYLP